MLTHKMRKKTPLRLRFQRTGAGSVIAILALSWLQLVEATIPPTRELFQEGYETIHQYRQRLGIPYNYNTQWVSPELCRTLSPDDCQALDKAFHQTTQSNKRFLSAQQNQSSTDTNIAGGSTPLRVLVMLLQWQNDADKKLIEPDAFNMLFNNATIDYDQRPTGSISRYFHVNSYGKFEIVADVVPWILINFSSHWMVEVL